MYFAAFFLICVMRLSHLLWKEAILLVLSLIVELYLNEDHFSLEIKLLVNSVLKI